MAVSAQQVQELRRKSGAGVMDCKRALEESGGNMDKAATLLRKQGMARADARLSRPTSEGVVASYIHAGGKIGVLVEVNCETDFVARTEEFQELARNLAMHIAAEEPRYVRQEEVPDDVAEQEKEVYRALAIKEGRPEKVLDRVVEGRLKKFYSEVCLLDQAYVRDDQKTVGELLKESMGKIGENIAVRRFVRYQLGEGDDG
ncbi:MAG: translation elongation factor Ts [Armatimonadota bacterium]|nr:MAG: translation elongation factor Ts [Armatimonadota bacterium]